MCGFAALLTDEAGVAGHARSLDSLLGGIAHRGGDGSGHWVDDRGMAALVHARLAIVDLSPSGAQPMTSSSGRSVISFNGELYNHRELRRRLTSRGRAFRGTSDTEVLLEGFEQWGLAETLRQAAGMFAFALFDRVERTLWIARDRFGEKPLYVWEGPNKHAFASDVRAFFGLPSWAGRVDLGAIREVSAWGYIRGQRTVFHDVWKLPPGEVAKFSMTNGRWLLRERQSFVEWPSPEGLPDSEVGPTFARTLEEVVGSQLDADVPVGVLLSAGVDSSAVAVAGVRAAGAGVRTFTASFVDPAYNEGPSAARFAARLGTQHTDLRISEADVLRVATELPLVYSEPFADPSQIPTHALCCEIRRHVKVALGGDGGDELFGGYNRYRLVATALERRAALRAIWWGARPVIQVARRVLSSGLPGSGRLRGRWADRRLRTLLRLGDVCARSDCELSDAYRVLMTRLPEYCDDLSDHHGDSRSAQVPDTLTWMTGWDRANYLPDDILVKVDRAAMAVALETRVPFLDPRLVALLDSLPWSVKHRGGRPKGLLREYLEERAPWWQDQGKRGFDAPIGRWLRGPLREWAGDLIGDLELRKDLGLDSPLLDHLLDRHWATREDWSWELWGPLACLAWGRHYLSPGAPRGVSEPRLIVQGA